MKTCRSPWTVMQLAYRVGCLVFPRHTSRYSRHDFTLPQLFACLVVRERMRLSFRDTEVLLLETTLCQRLGMSREPDHATLHRAHKHIVQRMHMQHMLDATTQLMRSRLSNTLAVDSTMFDTHHHSRHYEKRCGRHTPCDENALNHRRSVKAKGLPKLAIGIDVITHMITSMLSRTGLGNDAPLFKPLLLDACRRMHVQRVLADAGFDSQHNHGLARDELDIESLIKADTGRPGARPPTNTYRRLMKHVLAGSQQGQPYGQRAQVETVMSMLKRNLGQSLRCRTAAGREGEMLFKAVVHNLMIA